MKFNRDDLKEQLRQRAQESYETKDDSGKYGSYLQGVPFPKWKCGEGEHVIDILPFFCGENYPTKSHLKGNYDPKRIVYWLDTWVHFNIGANEDSIVCPNMSFGEPCPICEDVISMQKQKPVPEDIIKSTKAKRRAAYLVICRDGHAEESKGIQLFEVSHFYMEKHIAAIARKPLGGGYVFFSDPYDGKSVYFTKSGTGINQEFAGHQFVDRDYAIPDEILDKITPLADYLVYRDYDEIYQLYWGKPPGAAGEPRPQTTTRAPRPAPQQEEEQKEEQPQTSTRTPRPAPQQEAAPATRARRPVQEAPPEAQPTPAPRARRPVQQEEQPQEQPSPAPRARRPVQQESAPSPAQQEGPSCPGKGVFGVDVDKLTHCGICDMWDDCAVESERLEKLKK